MKTNGPQVTSQERNPGERIDLEIKNLLGQGVCQLHGVLPVHPQNCSGTNNMDSASSPKEGNGSQHGERNGAAARRAGGERLPGWSTSRPSPGPHLSQPKPERFPLPSETPGQVLAACVKEPMNQKLNACAKRPASQAARPCGHGQGFSTFSLSAREKRLKNSKPSQLLVKEWVKQSLRLYTYEGQESKHLSGAQSGSIAPLNLLQPCLRNAKSHGGHWHDPPGKGKTETAEDTAVAAPSSRQSSLRGPAEVGSAAAPATRT